MFKRLASFFNTGSDSGRELQIAVLCERCGEEISTRIDLNNDLSVEYGEGSAQDTFICRKTMMGSKRCFNRVEIELTFDAHRRLIERKIRGGEFARPE